MSPSITDRAMNPARVSVSTGESRQSSCSKVNKSSSLTFPENIVEIEKN